MALKTYRDLEVWKTGMDLVEAVYSLSKLFPPEERYGLTSQIQRAAVSVPANIAEGYGRKHRREYLNHRSIAHGSLLEVETHLLIAVRLKYIDREDAKSVWAYAQDVGKMLRGLRTSLLTDE